MTRIILRRMMCFDENGGGGDYILVERWVLCIHFESGGVYSFVTSSRANCIKELETIYD